jgi:hypothetical protein
MLLISFYTVSTFACINNSTIQLSRMRWAGFVERMGEKRDA